MVPFFKIHFSIRFLVFPFLVVKSSLYAREIALYLWCKLQILLPSLCFGFMYGVFCHVNVSKLLCLVFYCLWILSHSKFSHLVLEGIHLCVLSTLSHFSFSSIKKLKHKFRKAHKCL